MLAGALELQMSANIARLARDMDSAKRIVSGTMRQIEKDVAAAKNVLAGLGVGISAAALVALGKRTIDAADKMSDLRTRSGLAAQEILTLEGAALRGGVEIDAVSDVTSKLSLRLAQAAQGSGDAANALAAMGMKATTSGGSLKSVNEFLKEAGERFKGYEDGAEKAALATALFGKGGDRLIPVIEAIAETERRFKRLGITISDDLLTAADKFNDTMLDLKSVSDVFSRQIIFELLPHLQRLVEVLIEFKKQGNDSGNMLKALVIGANAASAAFLGMVTVVQALGEVLAGVAVFATQFFTLNFSAAPEALVAAWDGVIKRFRDYGALVNKMNPFNPPSGREVDNWDLMGDVSKLNRRRAPTVVDLKAANEIAKARAAFENAAAKIALDELKDQLKRREDVLSAYHDQSLISDQDYWSQRLAMQRMALDAELSVVDNQVARQRADAKRYVAGSKERIEVEKDIQEALAKRRKLEQDAAQASIMDAFAATRAQQAYTKSIEDVNAQLMELRGDSVGATESRISASMQDLLNKARINGDVEGEKRINQLIDATVEQAQFNKEREKLSDINARLQIEEERIQNTLRTGAISEIDAMNRTGEARAKAVLQQQQIIENLESIAKASGNPALILQAEQARAALEKLRTETDLLAEKFDTIFKDSFSDAFSEFISGTKSAKDAFTDFSNSVVRQINRMVAEAIAKDLFKAMGMDGSNSPGSILSGVFRGGGESAGGFGGVGTDETSIISKIGGFIGGLIPSFDTGTDYVPKTGLALVHQGEKITPASENVRGGVVIHMHNSFAPNQDAKSISAGLAEGGQRVQRAMARYN